MTDVTIGAELKLTGLSSFKAGLRSSRKEAKGLRDRLRQVNKDGAKSMKRLGGGLKKVTGFAGSAVKAMAAVTLGVAGLGFAAVDSFGKFDLQMARLQTVLPAGANAMEQFGQKALETSTQFGTGIAKVSDAMFQSVSAGVPDAELDRFTKVVGEAAAGGFTDMSTVVDGLTTTLNAYGMGMENARSVSDSFFIANRLGKTTFEELSASLGKVAPTANALGVGYKELLAATISMTKGGIKTSEVMSALKAVFANVNKPSKEATEQAAALGLEFNTAALKAEGLSGFLNKLSGATADSTEAQVALFGSVEAFNAVARLTSQSGLKEFNDGLKALENGSDDTARAFGGVQDTVGFKMQQIKNSFGRFAIEIGAGLVEGLGLDKIENIPEAIERAAKTVRNSAKMFAKGFSEAFAPLNSAASFDWAGMAKTLGAAAGNIASAFMKVASIIGDVLNSQGFKDFMFVTTAVLTDKQGISEGGAEAAAAKQGVGRLAGTQLTGFDNSTRQLQFAPIDAAAVREAAKTNVVARESFFAPGNTRLRNANIAVEVNRLRAVTRATQRKMQASSDRDDKRFAAAATKRDNASRKRVNAGFAEANKRFNDEGAAQIQRSGKQAGGRVLLGGADNSWMVNINWDQSLKVKDKEAKKSGGFSARGRGNAVLQSTSEQMYLLTENQIIPMSDEFHFAQLLTEVNS